MKAAQSIGILLCSLLLIAFTPPVKPAFHFKKGDEHRLHIMSDQSITQTIMGKEQLVESHVESDILFQVRAVLPGDIYLVEMRYDSVSMQEKSPFGDIQGKSYADAGDRDILAKAFKEVIATPMSMKLTSTGEIQAFIGIDTLLEHVFTPFTQLTEQSRISLKESLKKAFGDQSLLSYVQQLSAMFPKKQVNPGNKWSSQTILAGGMYGLIDNSFTLVSCNADSMVISQQGRIKPPKKNDFERINGMVMKFTMNGSLTGNYAIDASSGWIIKGQLKQSVTGKVTLQGTPQLPNGIEYPIEITTTTRYFGQ